jgi:hypothetical protein
VSLRIPGGQLTVWAFLKARGPMTLAEITEWTGIPQTRLRTHLKSHRDAYDNLTEDRGGIKVRLWFVKGPIA